MLSSLLGSLCFLGLLGFLLAGGRLAVSAIEGVAIVEHGIHTARNDSLKVEALAQGTLRAYPYGIAETDGTLGQLHIIVGSVDGLKHISLVLGSDRENLGEEKIEEKGIVVILEMHKFKALEFELKTKFCSLRLEALLGQESRKLFAKRHVIIVYWGCLIRNLIPLCRFRVAKVRHNIGMYKKTT